MLVTHANIEKFGLTPLFGDRRGYMPPLLKTKQVWPKNYENGHRNVFVLSVILEKGQKQQNSGFQGHFSMSKIDRIFLNFFSIKEYKKRRATFVIVIF